MRRLGLAAAAAVAVLGAALLAVAVWLPRYVRSDAVRAQLEAEAEAHLGRDVQWRDLAISVLPPSLEVLGARIAGAAPGAPDWLAAEKISLSVALLPLLGGAVVLDSLRIEAPELQLVRTESGLSLPAPLRTDQAPQPGSAPGGSGAGGFSLAVREIELRDARLRFEDRTLAPPAGFVLDDVDLRLRGDWLHPFEVRGAVALADGGSLAARGTAGLDGALDLAAELDGFGLDSARPFLASSAQLEGAVTGTLAIRGPAAAPEDVSFDLRVDRGQLVIDEIEVRGTARLAGQLSGAWAAPTGHFTVDATQAELRYGGVFHKPPGTPAHLEGRLVRGADGRLGVDDVRLRIQQTELRGAVETDGDTIRSRDLVAEIGGQAIPVQAEIRGAGGAWDARLTAAARQVEVATLLAALGGPGDQLSGPLDFDADLAAAQDGPDAPPRVDGAVRFEIRPGSLRGVSILEATFRAIDQAGSSLLRPLRLAGSPKLQRYSSDRFDSMSATLALDGETARTQDFRMLTPEYEFEMRGTIRLADLGLDAVGALHLGETLTGDLIGLVGAGARRGPGLVIAIPRLRGTLTDPQPTVDASVFWRSLLGSVGSVGRGAKGLLEGLGGHLVPGR